MAKGAVLFATAVALALSDIPGTPPCKIQGTVTQTSGSLNLP